MTKKEFLKLAREVSWLGVDFILRYNNPKWLGMADVHKGMHQAIDECKKQIEEAKQGIRSWEDVKSTVLVHVPRGTGKEQPIFCRVLTPVGWRSIGSIKVGDIVYDLNGKPTRVIGVYPQGRKPYYRITTESGRITYSGLDHLWAVYRPEFDGEELVVKPLRDILKQPYKDPPFNKKATNYNTKYFNFLPPINPIEFQNQDLPIDPYILGVWLGSNHFPLSYNSFEDQLSHNKYIPLIYLFSDVAQRLSLLQGLFDTAGAILKNGKEFTFQTTTRRLAEGVLSLIRSLGGKCFLFPSPGMSENEQLTFTIQGSLPQELNPFKFSKNRAKWVGLPKEDLKDAIVNIEYLGVEESVCIAVESETEIYITDDYIPTHNTTQLLGRILWELGKNPNHKIKIVCETDDNARKRVIFLQQQILQNKHLQLLFPHLKPADSGLWNNLQLYVERDIVSVDPSIEGCGILSSSTGGRATILFCLDSQTEILTKRGWIFGTELRKDDEIAVYNPYTKDVYFSPPLKIHIVEGKRRFVDVRTNRNLASLMVVTDDHKVIYKKNGKFIVTKAINLTKEDNFSLITAGYKKTNTVGDTVLLTYKDQTLKIKTEDFVWLLGFLLRTAYFNYIKLPNFSSYHTDYFFNILHKYGISYKRVGNAIYPKSKLLSQYCKLLAKSTPIHTIFPFIFDFSYKEYGILFDAFDFEGKLGRGEQLLGETIPVGGCSRSYIALTLSQIAPLCGVTVRPFIQTRRRVTLQVTEELSGNLTTNIGEKDDIWWCVTTPTGFFIAKRKDQVFVTGNCDDPIGMKNAIIYPENAKKAEESFYSNWLPMLEDDGFTTIAYTVWTENDFPYKMEKQGSNCIKYIRLVDDDLNPVWPDKFPKEKLQEIRNKIGPTAFARGYQGKPGSPKDKLFDKDALLSSINPTLKIGTLPKKDAYTFIGVDLAISKKKTGKRTALVVVEVDNKGKRRIIDVVAEKLSSIETAYKILNLAKRYNPLAIYVENNAYQEALIEWLEVVDTQNIVTGLVNGYYTGAQKFDPIRGLPALAVEIQKGLWEFPSTDHEYNESCDCPVCLLLTEFFTFPFGKTSDIVMATFFAREAYKDLIGDAVDLDIKFLILGND